MTDNHGLPYPPHGLVGVVVGETVDSTKGVCRIEARWVRPKPPVGISGKEYEPSDAPRFAKEIRLHRLNQKRLYRARERVMRKSLRRLTEVMRANDLVS